MILSRNQNQFLSSFASLGDLFKALMFLSNLNGFNSPPAAGLRVYQMERFFQGVEGKMIQVI